MTIQDIVGRYQLGATRFEVCSAKCIKAFTSSYPRAMPIKAVEDDEKADRPGADEQRGWRMHRWWNQFYKHRREAWHQWKVEMEFKRIRRKERKHANPR